MEGADSSPVLKHGVSAAQDLMIPLVIVLWEGEHYGGSKRQFVEDTPNLVPHAFNDRAQAVGVHPGPDYDTWKAANPGQEPFVVLYADVDYERMGTPLLL